jgi:hypothetical protein
LTPRNPLVIVENLAAHWNRAGGRRLSDNCRIGADLTLPARGVWGPGSSPLRRRLLIGSRYK